VVASPSIRLKPSHKAVGWSRAINSQCAHRRQDRGTIEPKLARPCVSAASPAPLAGARTAFAVIESLARRHLDPFCVAVAGFHPPIVRSLPCTTCDPCGVFGRTSAVSMAATFGHFPCCGGGPRRPRRRCGDPVRCCRLHRPALSVPRCEKSRVSALAEVRRLRCSIESSALRIEN
jgi:hypothetical protein